MVQFFLRTFRPAFYGFLTRLFYASSRVQFGKNLRCDSVPRILIDRGGTLQIGDNVELRRNVEIRVHNESSVEIGSQVRIDRGVRILAANRAKLQIGEKVRIGLYSVFNGGDDIRIGRACLISGFVYLQTSMHGYSSRTAAVQDQGYQHAPISLGEDSWLGTHVVVLPGVELARGVVVGSNAVVNRSVEEYKVVGGVPAREIKQRE